MFLLRSYFTNSKSSPVIATPNNTNSKTPYGTLSFNHTGLSIMFYSPDNIIYL